MPETEPANSFAAEVIRGAEAPGRPNALELNVRLLQGKLVRGGAQLIDPSGAIHSITVLGVTLVDYTHPDVIEPNVVYLGVTGVTLDVVQPGQFVVQPPRSGNVK
ncbi:MAG TPA: hypothetical protein VKQ36_02510 [Ktedonobacterales bacterium]|nr:hypothetical protein [Ktedonobacterales bacterium]